MPTYGFTGLDESGNPVTSPLTAQSGREALDQARAGCRHVVDLYRVTEEPEPREVSLLGEPNLPLPECLSLSWLPLPGAGRVPRIQHQRLAELVRNGEIQGTAGLFSLTVFTQSLLALSLRRVREVVFGSLRLAPIPAAAPIGPDGAEDRADNEVDELLKEMQEVRARRPRQSEPAVEDDDLLKVLLGTSEPSRRTPTDLADLRFSRAGEWLEDGVEERFTGDPRPIWRMAALLVQEAFRPGGGTRFNTIEVLPEPPTCRVRFSRAGEPPVEMDSPPMRLHSDLVVCLAASLGIRPVSLPPQQAEVPLRIDGKDFVFRGETRMTDWGLAITIRWRTR